MENDKKLSPARAAASPAHPSKRPSVRSEARDARLAKALRANLQRRKAAGREPDGGREGPPGDANGGSA